MRPLLTAVVALLAACATTTPEVRTMPQPEAPPPPPNPLLAEWAGEHGGVPPFDKVQVADFKPALEAAMEEQRREIAALVNNPDPPTFENTIAALERSGRAFNRVRALYSTWSSTMNDAAFQAVEREMAPRLAAFADEIVQNAALFKRVEAVYQSEQMASLTPEQQRLTRHTYLQFVRSGAQLDEQGKKRMAEINQRLAQLFTAFSQNVLADEQSYLVLEDRADLDGLPPSFVDAAAAAAEARGLAGKWVILNTRSSAEPFLTFAKRRDLREKVWRAFVSRGDNGDAHDNKATIAEILALRAERARLLGFETHAHWRLKDNSMAGTPERAMELMEAVWKPAVARVKEEVADMLKIVRKEGGKHPIEPWDYRYYAEKVRKAKYDLDENELKPYLQLEKLREGMFWVAGELYGFGFEPAPQVPVYHPDVRVWRVFEKASGKHVAYFYWDPYARPGKRSGAWMSVYQRQERFEREIPTIVSNNENFMKGKADEPTLISFDDATTLFHEFGHAIHGLSSRVNYPSLACTAVYRDYVELPSQLMERWLTVPEVLDRFALHYQTGEPMPQALRAKIEKASTFNQGFKTVEFLASALVDMKMHLAGATPIDPAAFERDTLKALNMPEQIVMRHRLPHFLHLFSSDSYSAGYYSYLWADTLVADAFEAFQEGKGPFDQELAKKFFANVLSVGNTVEPAEGYRAFRGRDPSIDALMRDRGFAPKKATAPARR